MCSVKKVYRLFKLWGIAYKYKPLPNIAGTRSGVSVILSRVSLVAEDMTKAPVSSMISRLGLSALQRDRSGAGASPINPQNSALHSPSLVRVCSFLCS